MISDLKRLAEGNELEKVYSMIILEPNRRETPNITSTRVDLPMTTIGQSW
jgi:hypothetical protein